MNAADTEIRDKLLDGRALTAAEEARLAADPALRQLAETLAAVAAADVPRAAPPAALDAAILRHARQHARRQRAPMLIFFRVALAAAAILVVVFTLRVYQGTPPPAVDSGTVSVAVDPSSAPAPAIEPGILSWDGDAVDLVLLEVHSQLQAQAAAPGDDPEMRQLIEALL